MSNEELVLNFLRNNNYTNDNNAATINIIVMAMGIDMMDYARDNFKYNYEAIQLMLSLEKQGKVENVLKIPVINQSIPDLIRTSRWIVKK